MRPKGWYDRNFGKSWDFKPISEVGVRFMEVEGRCPFSSNSIKTRGSHPFIAPQDVFLYRNSKVWIFDLRGGGYAEQMGNSFLFLPPVNSPAPSGTGLKMQPLPKLWQNNYIKKLESSV